MTFVIQVEYWVLLLRKSRHKNTGSQVLILNTAHDKSVSSEVMSLQSPSPHPCKVLISIPTIKNFDLKQCGNAI